MSESRTDVGNTVRMRLVFAIAPTGLFRQSMTSSFERTGQKERTIGVSAFVGCCEAVMLTPDMTFGAWIGVPGNPKEEETMVRLALHDGLLDTDYSSCIFGRDPSTLHSLDCLSSLWSQISFFLTCRLDLH
jgi:hypothetical protein